MNTFYKVNKGLYWCLWILLVSSVACQSEEYDYKVNIDTKHKQLIVESCSLSSPKYYYATSKNANSITTNIKWKSSTLEKPLFNKNRKISIPSSEKIGCLTYAIHAKDLTDRLNSVNFNLQHPEDFILSIDSWLWLPAGYKRSTKINIEFNHINGIQVSAPWKLVSKSANKSNYLMEYTPNDWSGYVAFGRFEIETLKLESSKLHIALINGMNHFNKGFIIDWIESMSQAVASIGGRFPIDEIQVLVIFQKGSFGAVPWGQVNRSGIPGVLFVVNPESSNEEIMQDWTAAHEFSHLLIPYTPSDRWLSEGFASYYQNISRARTGLLDEKSAWQKLIAGLNRGSFAAKRSDAPILKSANMRSLMQMYWGGAALALKADIELLKLSSGKINLSDVIKGLRDCCLHTGRNWTAQQTFAALDEISETTLFSELYHQEVMRRKFPEYTSLLKELGVYQSSNGEIKFDESKSKAELRKKIIMGSK
jgi:hypothetical protein